MELEHREVLHTRIPYRAGDRIIRNQNEVWEVLCVRKDPNTEGLIITIRPYDGISANAIRNR
jgi:hypothetical protein